MTDPRLIECAKALDARRHERGHVPGQPAMNLTPDDPVADARACILKWLEQEPSPQMLIALNEIGTFEGRLKSDASDWFDDPDAYTAMCAQAAKEIKE